MKILFKVIVLTIALVSLNVHAGGKKIIKWVDKNGVTQYGDRSPMPSKARKSSVLNSQGITVQRIELNKETGQQDKVSVEQARYDKALLGSYSSIEEIDIAQERNTKTDKLALDALEQKHKKLNTIVASNKKKLALAKKNRPASPEATNVTEKNKSELAKLEKQIEDKKATIKKINLRYENDKLRYIELKSEREK